MKSSTFPQQQSGNTAGTADKSKWPVFLQNASGNLMSPPSKQVGGTRLPCPPPNCAHDTN